MGKIVRPVLNRLLPRMQHLWRLAVPLWMFRDASRGTKEQRSANYRYNRSLRKVLPFYVFKWIGIGVCMMQLTRVFFQPDARHCIRNCRLLVRYSGVRE